MDAETRQVLTSLCARVEAEFPGALCAFEGFAQPRNVPEEDNCVLEVFLAPERCMRSVTRMAREDLRSIRHSSGKSVAIVIHYVDDTLRYYVDDVMASLAARRTTSVSGQGALRQRDFFDVGGFGSAQVVHRERPLPDRRFEPEHKTESTTAPVVRCTALLEPAA
jgi:hypothetical protein